MKNILICLERLDIGGVETFTIAQVKEYAKRGIKCYVLSQGGLLERKLKDLKNVELINFKFNIENRIERGNLLCAILPYFCSLLKWAL